jgi:predicted metal-dependent hydrolase
MPISDHPLPAGVLKGIEQFNAGAFYECHDSIELEWVAERGDVRLMYQGLLQISVAFHHVRTGNWRGMVKMIARGKGKLLPFYPECVGIDVRRLLTDVERCEVELRELGPERLGEYNRFPTIRVNR